MLIHFVWQGAAIAAFLALTFSLGRFQRPKIRYGICSIGLLAMVACPIVTFVTMRPVTEANSATSKYVSRMMETGESALPLKTGMNDLENPPDVIPATGVSVAQDRITSSAPAQEDGKSQLHVPTTSMQSISRDHAPSNATESRSIRLLWLRSQPWIVIGWLTGVIALSVRLLFGWIGLLRLRRRVEIAPAWMNARLQQLAISLRVAMPLIHLSHRVTEAIAVGFVRPMILIPATWVTELPPDMIEAVILHELIHIRRGDLWVNLLQRIVETLLFYHPAVWWVSRRLRVERELCCDEQVVQLMQNPLRYAETLEQIGRLNFANSLRLMRAQANLSVSIASRHGILLKRIRAILNIPTRERTSVAWLAGLFPLAFAFFIAGSQLGQYSAPASDDARHGDPTDASSISKSDERPSHPSTNLNEALVDPATGKVQIDEVDPLGHRIAVNLNDAPDGLAEPQGPKADLNRVVRIDGKVVDARGIPIAMAPVVYPVHYDRNARKWRVIRATSNDQGEFSLAVPRFLLSGGFANIHHIAWSSAERHGIGTASIALSLTEPHQKPIQIELPDEEPCDFIVRTEDGKPVSDAIVTPGLIRVPNGNDPIDGMFGLSYPLPDELSTIAIRRTDQAGRVRLESVPRNLLNSVKVITKSHGEQEFNRPTQDLQLRPVTSIEGCLTGAPPEILKRVHLLFSQRAGDVSCLTEVETDDAGRFSIPVFPVGSYNVGLADVLPDHWILGPVEPGAQNVEVRLVQGVQMKGRLVVSGTNQGVPSASIFTISGMNQSSVTSNDQGEFSTFVLAGQYVSVQVYGLEGDFIYPEITGENAPADATELHFPDIEIAPAKRWSGKLIDETGNSIEGRYVIPIGIKTRTHAVRTDVAGGFQTALSEGEVPKSWEVIIKWRESHNARIPAELISEDPLIIRVNSEVFAAVESASKSTTEVNDLNDGQDDLFVVVPVGQRRMFEFEKRITHVRGYDAKMLEVKTLDSKRIQVDGILEGLTILSFTDANGTEFTTAVEVIGLETAPKRLSKHQPIKLKPRRNPQRILKIEGDKSAFVVRQNQVQDLEFNATLTRVGDHDPNVIEITPRLANGLQVRGLSSGKTTFVAQGTATEPDGLIKKFAVEVEVVEREIWTRNDIRKLFADSAAMEAAETKEPPKENRKPNPADKEPEKHNAERNGDVKQNQRLEDPKDQARHAEKERRAEPDADAKNGEPAAVDDLFIVVPKGRTHVLEFENPILRVESGLFDPEILKSKVVGRNKLQVEGSSIGSTILVVTDDKKTVFATGIEVRDPATTQEQVQEPQSIKLKPRESPRRPSVVDRDNVTLVVFKNRARVLKFAQDVIQVDDFDRKVASVSALAPNRLWIRGSSIGKTAFTVQTKSEQPGNPDRQYSVEVEVIEPQAMTRDQIQKLFAEIAASDPVLRKDDSNDEFEAWHGPSTPKPRITAKGESRQLMFSNKQRNVLVEQTDHSDQQPSSKPDATPITSELFLVVPKGRSRLLKFDRAINRAQEFDLNIIGVKAVDPKTIRVEGLIEGLTILSLNDENGTEFTTPVEVTSPDSAARTDTDAATIKLKPRQNPLRRVKVSHNDTKVVVFRGYERSLQFPRGFERVFGTDEKLININETGVGQLAIRGMAVGSTKLDVHLVERSNGYVLLGRAEKQVDNFDRTVAVEIEVAEISREQLRKQFTENEFPSAAGREIYQRRKPNQRLSNALKNGGSVDSERAMEKSLKWLASVQESDGSWSSSRHGGGAVQTDQLGHSRSDGGKFADTGVTGLVVLSFLGAGYTHEEGLYATEIRKAIHWLISLQQKNGPNEGSWEPRGKWAGIGGRFYSTTLATMCLEVYYRYQSDAVDQKKKSR